MKHAFLVIAHNEEALLLALLKQLNYKDFDVYLHIDAKAEGLRQSIERQLSKHGNVFLVANPVDVYWGDVSQIECEMLLFKTAAAHGPYKYYHLISGVDLLLKSPEDIVGFFERHNGKEFVNFWDDGSAHVDLEKRVLRYHVFTKHIKDRGTLVHSFTSPIKNIVLALHKITRYKRPDKGFKFRKGSNWVSITEDFCQYLNKNGERLYRRLKHTYCADEVFVQTLIWNSPFRDNIYDAKSVDTEPSNLRKIDWQRGSPSPYVWQDADLHELLESSALFARKFTSGNRHLINEILQHTLGMENQR